MTLLKYITNNHHRISHRRQYSQEHIFSLVNRSTYSVDTDFLDHKVTKTNFVEFRKS